MKLKNLKWLLYAVGVIAIAILNYVCSQSIPFMQGSANSHNGKNDNVEIMLFLTAVASSVLIIWRSVKNKKIDGLSFVLIFLVITCVYWIDVFSDIECMSCSKA